jgi:hypothetical protein
MEETMSTKEKAFGVTILPPEISVDQNENNLTAKNLVMSSGTSPLNFSATLNDAPQNTLAGVVITGGFLQNPTQNPTDFENFKLVFTANEDAGGQLKITFPNPKAPSIPFGAMEAQIFSDGPLQSLTTTGTASWAGS